MSPTVSRKSAAWTQSAAHRAPWKRPAGTLAVRDRGLIRGRSNHFIGYARNRPRSRLLHLRCRVLRIRRRRRLRAWRWLLARPNGAHLHERQPMLRGARYNETQRASRVFDRASERLLFAWVHVRYGLLCDPGRMREGHQRGLLSSSVGRTDLLRPELRDGRCPRGYRSECVLPDERQPGVYLSLDGWRFAESKILRAVETMNLVVRALRLIPLRPKW